MVCPAVWQVALSWWNHLSGISAIPWYCTGNSISWEQYSASYHRNPAWFTNIIKEESVKIEFQDCGTCAVAQGAICQKSYFNIKCHNVILCMLYFEKGNISKITFNYLMAQYNLWMVSNTWVLNLIFSIIVTLNLRYSKINALFNSF